MIRAIQARWKGGIQFVKWRLDLENHLAANWPLFWSHQPGIIFLGCIWGVFISFCIAAMPYFSSSPEITIVTNISATLLQTSLFLVWILKLVAFPFPTNVIEYKTSPKFVTISVIFVTMIFGPIAPTIYTEGIDGLYLILGGEFWGFMALGVFAHAVGLQNLASPMLYAFLIGLLLSVIVFLFAWIGAGAAVITILISGVIVFALLRLVFSLRVGRRTYRDGGLILVGGLLLLGGIVFGIISIARPVLPPAPGKELGVDSRVIFLAAIVAAIWVDLSNWVLARFWLLPKVEP
jgi:hypothetical protein